MQEKKTMLTRVLAVIFIVTGSILRMTDFAFADVIALIGVFMGLFVATKNYFKKKIN